MANANRLRGFTLYGRVGEGARGAGELDEFPGVPDTNGMLFTVNCPVPVLAPPTFTG